MNYKDLNVNKKSPGAKNPNVILIVLDTVRADHLSLYGYKRNTTINIKTTSVCQVNIFVCLYFGDNIFMCRKKIFLIIAFS